MKDALFFQDDPNIEFVLLYSYFAFPKFSFFQLYTNKCVHRKTCQEFSRLVGQALEEIFGRPLMDPQWY